MFRFVSGIFRGALRVGGMFITSIFVLNQLVVTVMFILMCIGAWVTWKSIYLPSAPGSSNTASIWNVEHLEDDVDRAVAMVCNAPDFPEPHRSLQPALVFLWDGDRNGLITRSVVRCLEKTGRYAIIRRSGLQKAADMVLMRDNHGEHMLPALPDGNRLSDMERSARDSQAEVFVFGRLQQLQKDADTDHFQIAFTLESHELNATGSTVLFRASYPADYQEILARDCRITLELPGRKGTVFEKALLVFFAGAIEILLLSSVMRAILKRQDSRTNGTFLVGTAMVNMLLFYGWLSWDSQTWKIDIWRIAIIFIYTFIFFLASALWMSLLESNRDSSSVPS